MPITISGSTGIAGVDGSAATPAVQGTDTNTGEFFPAADTIAWATNGTERMRVNSSGNVGIGTSSPNNKLDLYTNAATSVGVNAGNSLNTWSYGIDSSGNYSIYSNGAYNIIFSNNATERMRIDSSGNLQFNSGYGSVATAYGCRAWVNFNGTTASPSTMRGNGNVSSVTKFGTGDFQVNFSTALVDANYSTVVTGDAPVNGQHCNGYVYYVRNVYSTTAVAVCWFNATNSTTRADPTFGLVAVFR